jgi:hypothetical protein
MFRAILKLEALCVATDLESPCVSIHESDLFEIQNNAVVNLLRRGSLFDLFRLYSPIALILQRARP